MRPTIAQPALLAALAVAPGPATLVQSTWPAVAAPAVAPSEGIEVLTPTRDASSPFGWSNRT